MICTIPELTLENALKFENYLNSLAVDSEGVVFDFSKMRNFDPLPMLMFGSIMRRYRRNLSDVPFYVKGASEHGYAGTMGFFKYLSEAIQVGKMPGEARGSANYIPITPINVYEIQKTEQERGNYQALGNIIENEASRLARVVSRGNKELHKLFTFLIREILRNTPEHAKTNIVWICGQFWPSYELAEIGIIDEGIGIYKSIIQNSAHREYITDNLSALQWSLKAGISESFQPSAKQRDDDEWANSGFGLYMVSKICEYLRGDFCIASYGSYMKANKYGTNFGESSFHGTAIGIRIPTGNISNAQNIISTIASQGETEAKTIRNAFKKASTPSKGLMEKLNIG